MFPKGGQLAIAGAVQGVGANLAAYGVKLAMCTPLGPLVAIAVMAGGGAELLWPGALEQEEQAGGWQSGLAKGRFGVMHSRLKRTGSS